MSVYTFHCSKLVQTNDIQLSGTSTETVSTWGGLAVILQTCYNHHRAERNSALADLCGGICAHLHAAWQIHSLIDVFVHLADGREEVAWQNFLQRRQFGIGKSTTCTSQHSAAWSDHQQANNLHVLHTLSLRQSDSEYSDADSPNSPTKFIQRMTA